MIALILLLAVVLLAGLVLALLAPAYFYRQVIQRRNGGAEGSPTWLDTVDAKWVSIRSFDGLLLQGRYISAPGGAGASGDTVILAHGYRGDGRWMGEYGRLFYEGFHRNILIPDARGHGLSAGDYVGFGWHERLDYLRWIDWVKEQAGGSSPVRVVLFGVSMGAATVMMTAGENPPPELKAVIADCGYTSVEEELAHQLWETYHIGGPLGRWLLGATSRLTRKRAGYSFAEASALEQIKKSRVPILFIHGEADTFVPFGMVHRLYGECPAEKELYTVPGAGHGLSLDADPEGYRRRIAGFLGKHLPPARNRP